MKTPKPKPKEEPPKDEPPKDEAPIDEPPIDEAPIDEPPKDDQPTPAESFDEFMTQASKSSESADTQPTTGSEDMDLD